MTPGVIESPLQHRPERRPPPSFGGGRLLVQEMPAAGSDPTYRRADHSPGTCSGGRAVRSRRRPIPLLGLRSESEPRTRSRLLGRACDGNDLVEPLEAWTVVRSRWERGRLLGQLFDGALRLLPRGRARTDDLDVADDLATTLDLELADPDFARNAPGRAHH